MQINGYKNLQLPIESYYDNFGDCFSEEVCLNLVLSGVNLWQDFLYLDTSIFEL